MLRTAPSTSRRARLCRPMISTGGKGSGAELHFVHREVEVGLFQGGALTAEFESGMLSGVAAAPGR
ncbi:hypothetical protein [Streptomyces sp. B1I3]|uniref:hypothetical protein n=1 Tax=Streptomyces sp. B1I3 TaxID=3042264 RepID=UPI002780066A|nr:hypothetical protein [Streptomyces sp. B1I3]MDQ0797707.1 hypothetical protein [Streptomyces sp. B1I3]